MEKQAEVRPKSVAETKTLFLAAKSLRIRRFYRATLFDEIRQHGGWGT
jgi:hypothetical protein